MLPLALPPDLLWFDVKVLFNVHLPKLSESATNCDAVDMIRCCNPTGLLAGSGLDECTVR